MDYTLNNKSRHKNNTSFIEYRSAKIQALVLEGIFRPILDELEPYINGSTMELQHCLVITFSELDKETKKVLKDKLRDMPITHRFYKNKLFIEIL
jgi:hypothetical protein